MIKVYVAGQKYFGWQAYELVKRLGIPITGVSSPAYRNARLSLVDGKATDKPDRLRDAANRDGVAWLEAGLLRAETLPAGTDLIIAAHSHDFIGRKTRHKATLGAIGYHPSLLPLHRGRDAVRWTVRLRERVTGGTVFWLNDTVDGGPVAAQAHVLIRPEWDAATLWREALQPLGLQLLAQVLTDIQAGRLVKVPQDHALATWEPALDPPALYRPELPQLGALPAGYRVEVERLYPMDYMPASM